MAQKGKDLPAGGGEAEGQSIEQRPISAATAARRPSLEDTGKLLECIAPGETQFTFQTFDDQKRGRPLAKVFHGTLAQYAAELTRLNELGAGIYVTVNRTDLRGRKAANITKVRAVFVDLDGAPLERATAFLKPSAIVVSSTGRWHLYWRVEDFSLEAFAAAQKSLAEMVGGDPAVHDLPRVMRLPGFDHMKAEPFRVTLESAEPGVVYSASEINRALAGDNLPRLFTRLGEDNRPRVDVVARLAAMTHHGEGDAGIHNTQLSVTASLMSAGAAEDEIVDKVLAATKAAVGDAAWNWDEEAETIRGMCRDWAKKYPRSTSSVTREDFRAYMPMHNYIYMPTRESWPAASVNAAVGKSASAWLDRNRAVHQMTWAPGEPELIENRLVADGGWIFRDGVSCLNLYRPPTTKLGSAAEAGPWLNLVGKVYRGDGEHILDYFAHCAQKPGVKINHALLLGGAPGIGKDTLLEPVKRAVGPWNFAEVSPKQLLGRFNSFVKSVVLRISEAHDLGEMSRFQFYDHMKTMSAAPPDVLRVDEKNLREHAVMNCCKVVITTNHKTDGIYLPADDRRHYVAWSDAQITDFDEGYWKGIWGWYESGGFENVTAYLLNRDIASFDPKAPPKKTEAFWEIVSANRAPEDDDLADIIDRLGSPLAITIDTVLAEAGGNLIGDWLVDRRNRRAIPHRLSGLGYNHVRNSAAKDGRFVARGKRLVIYAKATLSPRDQLAAAADLVRKLENDVVPTITNVPR